MSRNAQPRGPAGAAIAIALAVAAPLVSSPASAQQRAPLTHAQTVTEGRVLAERLCRGCHVVDDRPDGTAQAGIPSLKGIANRPGQTAERIRNVLINPHPPMPDVQISRPEIERLLAYIDSLRADTSGPPLVPREDPPRKPVYPDPS